MPAAFQHPGQLGGLLDSAGNLAVSDMVHSLSGTPRPQIVRSSFGLSAILYFAQNSALLDAANFKALEQLARELRFMWKPIVQVDGHASAEGREEVNEALSSRRRQAVITLLKAQSDEPLDIGGEALGETDPAMPETAEDEEALERQRAQNRRVEITIVRQPEKPPPPPPPNFDVTPRPPIPPYLDPNLPGPAERQKKSGRDAIDQGMDAVLDEFGIKRPWVRDLLKRGAWAGMEKGAETALDEALGETNLSPEAKEAFKKSMEAVFKFRF